MQALSLNQTLSYRTDVSIPSPTQDEALIRLSVAGICATDLELVKGYAGFSGIIGHEFVGVVEAVGHAQHRHWLGRRVVGSINIGCGRCATCRQDGPEHCRQRQVLGIRGKHGVFADYFTLPVANLYELPDTISDQAAVFTEPLAAAVRVAEQLQSIPITRLAVIGPGRLGLLIAKVLSLAGYAVDVLGRTVASLQLPQHWQMRAALSEEMPDDNYDCVVDASGRASGFEQALRLLRPRGTLVLKSTWAATEPVALSKIVVAEINLIGSRCGPFPVALALLQQGQIPVETLIDGQYRLEDGATAFRHAAEPGVRKILLSP